MSHRNAINTYPSIPPEYSFTELPEDGGVKLTVFSHTQQSETMVDAFKIVGYALIDDIVSHESEIAALRQAGETVPLAMQDRLARAKWHRHVLENRSAMLRGKEPYARPQHVQDFELSLRPTDDSKPQTRPEIQMPAAPGIKERVAAWMIKKLAKQADPAATTPSQPEEPKTAQLVLTGNEIDFTIDDLKTASELLRHDAAGGEGASNPTPDADATQGFLVRAGAIEELVDYLTL
jgi:hypothetical protein